MKKMLIFTTALTLLVAPVSGAFAQGWNNNRHDNRPGPGTMMRHDNHRDHRNEWRKGGRIDRNNWNRGQRVNDWQNRRLQRPPRGYEWRRVDDNYVLAAVATGVIASILLANR